MLFCKLLLGSVFLEGHLRHDSAATEAGVATATGATL